MTQIDFQPATNCISWNARVLIRGVLAHHFFGAEVEPVVFAPRACQKGDGGFGTGSNRSSGPATAGQVGLRLLDDVDTSSSPTVARACDYLSVDHDA